jgi:hypothetical protein
MSSSGEERVLGIRARKVLRSVAMDNLSDVFEYEDTPFDVLRSLRDQGYIKVDLKKHRVPSHAKITEEGGMLLDASDLFYEHLAKHRIIEDENSYKLLLTLEKMEVMLMLASKKAIGLHEVNMIINGASVDENTSKLLRTMHKQRFINFDEVAITCRAKERGLIALEATEVFYERLTQLGFFENNGEDNGEESDEEEEPLSARDAFADFDGESHLERSSDAAE